MRRASTAARPVPPRSPSGERSIERPIDFAIHADQVKQASVVGTFNGWNPSRNPMRKEGDVWFVTLWLPPGRYEYRFVLDGEWVSDPNARRSVPNPYGSTNSVILV